MTLSFVLTHSSDLPDDCVRSDECVSTKLGVTEEHVCFLICPFYFMIALYSGISSTIARIGTLFLS